MNTRPKTRKWDKTVLVGVLKDKRDLKILLKKRWYRIPVNFLPKRKFSYLAFYQPVAFGKNGKRIQYYARVWSSKIVKRIELLPQEAKHPRVHDDYLKLELAWVKKLKNPIQNIIPRRVSFGFTSLKSLLRAGDILELYGVSPTEQIVNNGLLGSGIQPRKEFTISKRGKRYRIDLAIFCKKGNIAIECDNLKAHGSKIQKHKDRLKDLFLCHLGWHVIRLREQDIREKLPDCLNTIEKTVKSLGGQLKSF